MKIMIIDYLRFDDLVHKFHLALDQNLFHQYVKIFLAIPESWENNRPSSIPIINGSTDILQLFKHNANEIWSFTKSEYSILIENVGHSY